MTAQIIAAHLGLSVQPRDDLIDIDYGSWQGLSPEEAAKQDGDLYARWVERPHEVRFPQGESLQDVRHRLIAVIDKALAEPPEQAVILVSHVVVCRVFICVVLGLDDSHLWQIGQDVCAINSIGIRDGKLMLNSLNDTCHLRNISQ
jgi:broad specificity phosphatase PhoE